MATVNVACMRMLSGKASYFRHHAFLFFTYQNQQHESVKKRERVTVVAVSYDAARPNAILTTQVIASEMMMNAAMIGCWWIDVCEMRSASGNAYASSWSDYGFDCVGRICYGVVASVLATLCDCGFEKENPESLVDGATHLVRYVPVDVESDRAVDLSLAAPFAVPVAVERRHVSVVAPLPSL